MKTAIESHDHPGRFTVDGREISEDELTALKAVFPGDWLVIRFEDPPFTNYRKILKSHPNDIDNGD